MKAVICLCALVVVAVARPDDKYTDKYDHVNVQEMLANPRVKYPFIECALGTGKCTPEAKELASHLEEGLRTHCAKCTDKQKEAVHIVIKHLINEEPEYWKKLCAKYDSDGKYAKKYEDELKTIVA